MAKTKTKPQTRQCSHCAAYFDPETLEGAAHLAGCRIYNGWKNYETWLVSLWLDNEEHSYNYWREAAEEARQGAADEPSDYLTPKQKEVYLLARRLKEEVRESVEGDERTGGVPRGMAHDLIGAAFDEVDWDSIAEGFLEQ